MNPELLRRVRHLRRLNPFRPIGVQHAVQAIRHEQRDPSPAYAFLSNLDGGSCTAVGEVGPMTITVHVVTDEEARLGDDDVTGTFTDRASEWTVPNTRRDRNTDCAFYEPSSYRRQQTRADYTARGMSRSVATDARRFDLDLDMADDASRAYYALIVTISVDDRELAHTSLWGIDTIDGHDGRGYFIETAEDLIEEALSQAKDESAGAAIAARTHADRVVEAARHLEDN